MIDLCTTTAVEETFGKAMKTRKASASFPSKVSKRQHAQPFNLSR